MFIMFGRYDVSLDQFAKGNQVFNYKPTVDQNEISSYLTHEQMIQTLFEAYRANRPSDESELFSCRMVVQKNGGFTFIENLAAYFLVGTIVQETARSEIADEMATLTCSQNAYKLHVYDSQKKKAVTIQFNPTSIPII